MPIRLLYCLSFFFILILQACDKFSVNKDDNCLNPKSTCYLGDKTTPIQVSSIPPNAQPVFTLSSLEIFFTEKLKDAEDPSKYSISLTTGQFVGIASVSRTGENSVRLVFDRAINGNPTVTISSNGLTDYGNNPVSFTITIPIIGDISYSGITNNTAIYFVSATNQPNANVQWSHLIDVEPGTGTGAASEFLFRFVLPTNQPADNETDCAAIPPLALFSGTNTSGNLAKNIQSTNDINYTFMEENPQPVLICVSHTNPNNSLVDKQKNSQFFIVRKDTLPVSTPSPAPGSYSTAQVFSVGCHTLPVFSEVKDCDKIAYATTSTANPLAVPLGNPSNPDFDANWVPQNGTTIFSEGGITLADPSVTRIKLLSKDKAKNKEAVIVDVTYTVDTNLPVVQIVSNQHDNVSVNAGAFNSSNLTWRTNRGTRPFEIRVDGSACGSVLFTPLIAGNSQAVANANDVRNIPASALSDGANTIRVCVQNLAGNWGEATQTIILDDDPPSLVMLPISGIYPGTVVYAATCLDGVYVCDKIAYTINSGPTVVAAPVNPAFDAAGNITSGNLYTSQINLSPPAQLFDEIKTIARDQAGNASTIVSQSLILDATYPTITITGNTAYSVSNVGGTASTNLTWTISDPGSDWNIRIDAADCTGGTIIATGATSLATNNINLPATLFPATIAHSLRVCAYNSVHTVEGFGNLGSPITRDDTAPTITNITSSQSNGTYIIGQSLILRVTVSEVVTVTGAPRILLNSGGSAYANYTSGSGSSTLAFTYTIASGESAGDLNYAATNSLTLNGGTIKDAAANNATLTLPATGGAGSLGTNKNFVIDGVRPTVTIGSLAPLNSATNQSIAINPTVVFSEVMDTSSLTIQSLNGACTGSVQLSADNFSTCIGSVISFGGSPTTATINPGVAGSDYLGYIKTYKRRVTVAAKDSNGNTIAAQYTDATGFSTPTTINVSGYQLNDTGFGICYRTTDSGNTWIANGVCTGFTIGSLTYPYGQDPHYNASAFQFYTTDGYETVTDYRSSVIWERCMFGQTGPTCTGTPTGVTYSQAAGHCSTLTTAGRTWRLPTIKELQFITDFSQPNPLINTAFFTGTPANQSLWSSTVNPDDGTQHFRMYYGSGTTSIVADTSVLGVRCVSTPVPAQPAYVPSLSPAATGPTQTGTVVDSKTGLEWHLCSLSGAGGNMGWSSSGCLGGVGTHSWIDAVNFCQNLSWNSFTDWRLPNHKELLTLVNHAKTASSPRAWAPENFWLNGQYNGRYWTSSKYSTTTALYVDFANGQSGAASTALATKYAVRCVR